MGGGGGGRISVTALTLADSLKGDWVLGPGREKVTGRWNVQEHFNDPAREARNEVVVVSVSMYLPTGSTEKKRAELRRYSPGRGQSPSSKRKPFGGSG